MNENDFDVFHGDSRALEQLRQDDQAFMLKGKIIKETLNYFGVQDEYLTVSDKVEKNIKQNSRDALDRFIDSQKALANEVDRLSRKWKTGKYAEKENK